MSESATDAVYRSLVQDPKSCRPYLLSDRFYTIREAFVDEGNSVRARETAIEAVAFGFYATEHYPPGKRFAPYATNRFIPEWSDPVLPDIIAAHLRHQADNSPNPIHRARFRDLLWDRRREAKSGIAAISDYLDSASICLGEGWDLEVHDYLRRATQLTGLFKQTALASRMETEILATLHALESAGRLNWYARIAALIPESVAEEVTGEVAMGLRHVADLLRDRHEFHLYRRALQTGSVFQRRLKDEAASTALIVEVGLGYVLEAESSKTTTNFARAYHYQEAISHFANIGYSEPLNGLKVKLKEAIQRARELEMHEIHIPLPEMSAEEKRAMTDIFLSDTLDNALSAAALLFTPDLQEAKERSAQLIGDSILRTLAVPERISDEGNVSAAPRDDQERNEFWVFEELMRDMKLKHGFLLGPTLERLRQDGGLTEDTLLNYLQTGAAFMARDNRLLSHGLRLYFSGDYVGALHVLVPQVESVLRGCLRLVGIATTSVSRENQAVMSEKPLGVILEEPALRNLLGEDVITYFSLVYNDARGMNLRNEVAHGIAAYSVFDRRTCDTVIHTLLVLSLIRLVPKATSSESIGEATEL